MEGFLLFIHVVVCILLIVVVLLQSGKSADLAGAFGGYGSQSTFGPRGAATFLSKFTTILAVLFMVLTLLLMIIASRKTGPRQSTLDKEDFTQEQKTEAGTDAQKGAAASKEDTQKPSRTDAGVPDGEKDKAKAPVTDQGKDNEGKSGNSE